MFSLLRPFLGLPGLPIFLFGGLASLFCFLRRLPATAAVTAATSGGNVDDGDSADSAAAAAALSASFAPAGTHAAATLLLLLLLLLLFLLLLQLLWLLVSLPPLLPLPLRTMFFLRLLLYTGAEFGSHSRTFLTLPFPPAPPLN